jgi:hypothetical protein
MKVSGDAPIHKKESQRGTSAANSQAKGPLPDDTLESPVAAPKKQFPLGKNLSGQKTEACCYSIASFFNSYLGFNFTLKAVI